jgi:hypothetical protein
MREVLSEMAGMHLKSASVCISLNCLRRPGQRGRDSDAKDGKVFDTHCYASHTSQFDAEAWSKSKPLGHFVRIAQRFGSPFTPEISASRRRR